MADFCKQCLIELFGEDTGDLAGLCKEDELVAALCEGCGYCVVDHEGTCKEHEIEAHGQPASEEANA